MDDVLARLASFVPRRERLRLFRLLHESCGAKATATAKVVGINPRQVYFYLPRSNGRPRNCPNDHTMSQVLRAALKKEPSLAISALDGMRKEFNGLLEELGDRD